MRLFLYIILAANACLGCVDQNSTASSLPKKEHDAFLRLVAVRLELVQILENITDEDSAKQTLKEYSDVFVRMKECSEETGNIPIEVKQPIRKVLREELNSSISELNMQFSRVSAIPGVTSILRSNSK
ncbi:MAG: hypothetical protein ABGZ53_20975 [Fuerstiella sp.]